MKTKYLAYMIALLLVSILSCKKMPQSGSEVQSLENVDGDSNFEINHCGVGRLKGGDLTEQERALAPKYDALFQKVAHLRSKINNHPQADLVLQALVAVPVRILNAFFDSALKGTVLIDSVQAKKICHQSLSNAEKQFFTEGGQNTFAACISRGKDNNMVLYLQEETTDQKGSVGISHAVVRVLSYVYSDILLTAMSQSQDANMQKAAQSDKQYLALLYATFTAEIKNQNKLLNDLHAQNPEAAQRYVFADAVDSFYCSVETFNNFGLKFPNTLKVFKEQQSIEGQPAYPFARRLGETWFSAL